MLGFHIMFGILRKGFFESGIHNLPALVHQLLVCIGRNGFSQWLFYAMLWLKFRAFSMLGKVFPNWGELLTLSTPFLKKIFIFIHVCETESMYVWEKEEERERVRQTKRHMCRCLKRPSYSPGTGVTGHFEFSDMRARNWTLRSSAKVAGVPNCWAISPPPFPSTPFDTQILSLERCANYA